MNARIRPSYAAALNSQSASLARLTDSSWLRVTLRLGRRQAVCLPYNDIAAK